MQQGRSAGAPTERWFPAIESALVFVADTIIILVLQRAQVFEVAGVTVGWWGIVVPAVLACTLGALATIGRGRTAMPFGPNAVFIMAFAGVLAPIARAACAAGAGDACVAEVGGFIGAALGVYAALVASLAMLALRLDLQHYRRVLLMPLAAICWTFIVFSPAMKLMHERIAVALPALVLFVLLLLGLRKLVPWLVTLVLWLGLAWVTDGFPQAGTVSAATLPPFAVSAALAWLGRAQFWIDALPIIAPLAIANALGIIENLAAAREVGDTPSPAYTLGIVTSGTLSAAALGGNAPMTIYVGHAAFHRRGAGWLYSLLAMPLLIVIALFGNRVVDYLPTGIFLGAVAYLGATVGMLPRRHLKSWRDLGLALIVAVPVVVMGLIGPKHPVLAWIGRGGGLTAVAWSFFCFAPAKTRAREAAALLMALGCVLGLVHAQPFTVVGYVTAASYAAVAAVAYRYSATTRG